MRQSIQIANKFLYDTGQLLASMTVLKLARNLTRMVGLIAFGRPDTSVISPKVYKSMFKATYQTSGTLTTPATVTRSMGLPADAQAVKFFAATLLRYSLT
jgi:hypothetical protein